MQLDLALELLEDPAYRHVLLNHLPVTGLVVAWVVLLWGSIENRWASMVFGLVLVFATSASSIVVMEAGDEAYPVVFDLLDGRGRAWLDHHAELADRWGVLLTVNAGIAAAAIAAGFYRGALRRKGAVLVLATTLASLLAVGVIAEAGGKVRHPEFRLSDPPVTSGSGRIR